jgi:hypothetical protein
MEPPDLVKVQQPLASGHIYEWWEIQTSFVDRTH